MPARHILHLARESRLEDRGVGERFPILVTLEKHSGWGNTWLAQVTGVDEEAPGGFTQDFVDPESQNLSRAGNGAVMYAITEDGIYQANSVWRSYSTHRTIFRVKDGAVEILSDSCDGDTIAVGKKTLYIALTGAPKPRATRKPKVAVEA